MVLVLFSLIYQLQVESFGFGSCHRLHFLSKKHRRLDVHLKMEVTPICKSYFQSSTTPYTCHNTLMLIYYTYFFSWGTYVYMVLVSQILNPHFKFPFTMMFKFSCWFILFCAITKLSFNSLRSSYCFHMWFSNSWAFIDPFKGDVLDGGWYQ